MNKANIVALIIMVVSVVTLYASLEPKYVRKEVMNLVIDRLDRIEHKVDLIIQKQAQK